MLGITLTCTFEAARLAQYMPGIAAHTKTYMLETIWYCPQGQAKQITPARGILHLLYQYATCQF